MAVPLFKCRRRPCMWAALRSLCCALLISGMEEFSIREATPDDKKAVLAVRDSVYGGFDYLPQYYDYFMSAKNATSFVLLHKEEIIGFNTAFVVDDRKTVVSRAARINPGFEGRGLYRYLDQHLTDWAKSQKVTTKAFVTISYNPNVWKSSFLEQNKLILAKIDYMYTFEPAKIRLCNADIEKTADLTTVSDSLPSSFFSSTTVSEYLFPDERIIVDYVPFRLMQSNIELTGPKHFTEVYSDIPTNDNSSTCKGLLSFGTCYSIQAVPYRYEINLYGADMARFKTHIVKHLLRLKERVTGITALALFLEDNFPPERVDKILTEFGGTKGHESTTSDKYYTLYLYEKKLD